MSDLIVHGFGAGEGLLDLSPFVAKVEAYLRLAGVAYDKRPGNIRKAPRGKLPYLIHGERTITDSALILDYLGQAGLVSLDANPSAGQRAELCALRSLLESDLYFLLLRLRWQDPQGWAAYRGPIAASIRATGVPGPMLPLVLPLVRKAVVGQVRAQGAGRREPDEVVGRMREIFDALEVFAARQREQHGGPWWFGAQPTRADAIVHAFVSGCVVPKFGLPCETLLEGRSALGPWFEHVHTELRG